MKKTAEWAVDSEITEHALAFVEESLESMDVSMKVQHTFLVAVDELVSNVLNHSQAIKLRLELEKEGEMLSLTLLDDSFQFNPLEAKGNEDNTSDVSERPIGGLGIHMVKKMMDRLEYKYCNHQNIFRMEKELA